VSFAAITLCVASQRVFIIVVIIYFVIESVRKLLDTPLYLKNVQFLFRPLCVAYGIDLGTAIFPCWLFSLMVMTLTNCVVRHLQYNVTINYKHSQKFYAANFLRIENYKRSDFTSHCVCVCNSDQPAEIFVSDISFEKFLFSY
jgi:hypothetical protein